MHSGVSVQSVSPAPIPPHFYPLLQGSVLTPVCGPPERPAPPGCTLSTVFHGGCSGGDSWLFGRSKHCTYISANPWAPTSSQHIKKQLTSSLLESLVQMNSSLPVLCLPESCSLPLEKPLTYSKRSGKRAQGLVIFGGRTGATTTSLLPLLFFTKPPAEAS